MHNGPQDLTLARMTMQQQERRWWWWWWWQQWWWYWISEGLIMFNCI